MKSRVFFLYGFLCIVGFVSGCSGSDSVPVITPGGSIAAAEEQRVQQSDALTSHEAALVSQGNSEPVPAPKPDL